MNVTNASPGPPGSSGRLRYVPALDGVRGLSIAAVVAFHGGFPWASGGYLGVSTFFVLSGFLITSLLVVEHQVTGRIRLVAFWGRRFRRLMPAALLCLAGIVLFGAFVANAQQLWRLRADGLSALFYVANWRFLLSGQGYENIFTAPSPVQHFWSLAIEEQFYAAFPLIMVGLLALGRGARRPVWVGLLGLTAVSLALMMGLHSPEQPTARVYYGTDTRAAELLVGALLALAIGRWPGTDGVGGNPVLQGLGMAGLAFSLVLWTTATQDSRWLFEGGLVLYAAATAAVIAAGLRPGPVARLLTVAPLRQLGRISYGVYLYHWPIFLWLTPDRVGLDGWAVFLVQVAVTIAVSIASFLCIEQPIRSGRWRVDRRVWLAGPVTAASIAGALIAVTANIDVSAPTFWGGYRPMPVVTDDRTSVPRIMVFGDSLARSLGRALERWGSRSGRAIVWSQASYGCGIARGGTHRFSWPRDQVTEGECRAWADWWPIQLGKFRPDVAIVISGIWDLTDRRLPEWSRYRRPGDPIFDDWLLAEYEEAVDVLSSTGARVAWVTQPCIEPKYELGPLSRAGGVSTDRMAYLNRHILPRLAASRRETVALIDLAGHVCPEGRFQSSLESIEGARPDGVHFSWPASLRLAPWLGNGALALVTSGSVAGDARASRRPPRRAP